MPEQNPVSMARRLLSLDTKKRREIISLDRFVQEFVKESGIQTGMISIRTLHTTSGVIINEYEAGLMADIESFMNILVPEERSYCHDNPSIHPVSDKNERKNAFAHLQAILLGSGVSVSISEGRVVLGKWQSILFIELDGPRKERQIELTAMGV